MVSRRFVKRVVYIVGFFAFIVFLSGLFWWLVKPAAPPAPVAATPAAYREIAKEDVSVINHRHTVDVVVRLRNPNVRAGVANYPVSFVLFDSNDQEIVTHTEDTYILPGAVQYAAALNIPTGGMHVGRVEVVLPSDPVFSEIPAAVSLPTFSSFLHDRSIRRVGDRQIEEQRGVVRNTSTFDWNRVEVVGVALDTTGDVVGVSKTFLGLLKIDEQRDFTLQWPAPSLKTDRVIILPSTNVYLEENVIRAIGDPGLLR